MLTIHGLHISSNTTKLLYVAEELGLDYVFVDLDFMKGEHKTPEHMARHPLGKAPTLTHEGKTLFESSAICRYLASVEKSELYPVANPYQCGQIDQWMAFFASHLGRVTNSYAFEKVAKVKYGFGTPNNEAMEAALGEIKTQMPMLDAHLASNDFLVGQTLTIADCYAFAYMENAELADFPLSEYPNVLRWYSEMRERPATSRAWKKLGRK